MALTRAASSVVGKQKTLWRKANWQKASWQKASWRKALWRKALWRKALRRKALGVLLVLIACVAASSLRAQERISAYVDSEGRIVFSNDPVPVPSPQPSAPAGQPDSTSSNDRSRIDSLIDRASGEHQVDPELVRAMVQIEDRKSTRLNSSHIQKSRMPSSA